MTNDTPPLPHTLTLKDRTHLSVTGVTEVTRFDENAVALHTGLGILMIQGRDLKLKTLAPDDGRLVIHGHIDLLTYEDPRPQGGWLRRLLG